MSHLSSERLAELADGEPTVAEAEHLAACANCATERSAHKRLLTLALDERDRIAPPLTDWSTLSARLRDEGIISTQITAPVAFDAAVIAMPQPRPHRRAWLAGLRVAAGLVIAVGFGALGRISAGASAAPSTSEVVSVVDWLAGHPRPSGPANPAEMTAPFNDINEALAALQTSQRNYDRAVNYIAAHDSTAASPEAGDVFRTRLAALDEMAETSRMALSVAPADPVLNQYYISTLGAREVTLRQLGSALTSGKRLSRF